MKKVIVTVAVLGLIGGGIYYWKFRDPSGGAPPAPTTATVERGGLVVSVSSTGRIVSNLDVEVKCKAGGQVTSMPYDVSDPVKKDALLVELDPIDEQRNVNHAKVSLAASQAKLASAKENLAVAEMTLATDTARAQAALTAAESRANDARAKADRVKQLLDNKFASLEESETAETAAVQATADLQAAQVRTQELKTQDRALEVRRQDVNLAQASADADAIALEIAQDRLRDTKVLAPMDGVVSARNVQVGQIIASATSNVGGGTALLTLSDLSRIYVVAAVDESDIGKVQEDQPARITADAFPGKSFRGKVVQIATRGVNLSNVVTFEVKIEVTGEQKSLLKPEMTANVEITAARRENVLLAPMEGVVRRQGKFFAELVNGAGKEERQVEVGLSDGSRYEILSGLKEGDMVTVFKSGANRWTGQQGGPPRGLLPGGGGGRPR